MKNEKRKAKNLQTTDVQFIVYFSLFVFHFSLITLSP
jgi:hypothetical protein